MQQHLLLEIDIPLNSKWHTGSGESSFMVDRMIRRDSRNQPFIPGSTLKGIIRQSCEKLSVTLGFPPPSDPHQADLTQSPGFTEFTSIKSPVDRLFGSKFEASSLFFRDARLKDDQQNSSCIRNRVARYRVLKTARDKHLFTTEYANPATFHTRINGWHNDLAILDADYPPFAYALLIAGILAVDRIGGDKSTGSGWLDGSMKITTALYNGMPLDLDEVFEVLDASLYLEAREEQ